MGLNMKIIKFYSPSCGPCKVLDTNLKNANIEYESVNVYADENAELVDKYSIRNIPTLIKELDGVESKRFTGIMSVEQLKEWCNE